MALTTLELQHIRQALARGTIVTYVKAQINAAVNSIENTMTTRTMTAPDAGKTVVQIVSAEIDAASAPFVFSSNQKKLLFAYWAETKFLRDK
jgi:hypothetical protein